MGGPTYTGSQFPSGYQGDVFFADYVQGFIKKLNVNAQDQVTSVDNFATGLGRRRPRADPRRASSPTPRSETAARAPARSAGSSTRPRTRSPSAVIETNRTSGPAPLAVSFDGRDSTDPDGDPLTYEWSFGDNTTGSTQANPSHTYANPGTYTATPDRERRPWRPGHRDRPDQRGQHAARWRR